MEYIYQVLNNVAKLNKEELCEVYYKLNFWKWDLRLGNPPTNFYNLPDYNYKWYHILTRRKTKYEYVSLVIKAIRSVVSENELIRYYHLHYLGRTNAEFEQWWRIEAMSKATNIRLFPSESPNYISRDNCCNEEGV